MRILVIKMGKLFPVEPEMIADLIRGFIYVVVLLVVLATMFPEFFSALNQTQEAVPQYSAILGIIGILAVFGIIVTLIDILMPKKL